MKKAFCIIILCYNLPLLLLLTAINIFFRTEQFALELQQGGQEVARDQERAWNKFLPVYAVWTFISCVTYICIFKFAL